jgi:uncharacterized protein YjiK
LPEVREYDTPLSSVHNTEGLCYDKNHNRLLVAIKENEPGTPGYKGVYAFDLSTHKMANESVIKINVHPKAFSGMQKKLKKAEGILPSGIAIHPLTGDYYITEGRNSKLLILDSSASVKELYYLDKTEFPQPEGISFSPSGQLFISNEGAKQPGNILRVKLNPGTN